MRLTVFIEKLCHLFFHSLSDHYRLTNRLCLDMTQNLEVADVNKLVCLLEL
jgi:ribosomal protein L32